MMRVTKLGWVINSPIWSGGGNADLEMGDSSNSGKYLLARRRSCVWCSGIRPCAHFHC